MFKNIGEKLKAIAYFVFVCGIVGSVVGGLIIISETKYFEGILIIICGSLASWISSCVIYGIGEIASYTSNTYNVRKSVDLLKQSTTRATTQKTVVDNSSSKVCPHCGEKVTSNKCVMCGLENNLF